MWQIDVAGDGWSTVAAISDDYEEQAGIAGTSGE